MLRGNSQQRYFSTLNEDDINVKAGLVYRLNDGEDEISNIRLGYTGRLVDDNFEATIEFFGGTVNVTNLLAVNPDDDMFDFTQGYTSTEADPRGIEADGNLDGDYPSHLRQSDFRVENMTIVNNAANTTNNVDRMQDAIKIRRGAKATITNALVKGTDE